MLNKKLYRFGITFDTVDKRLKAEAYDFEIIKIMEGTLLDCYILVQQIHDLLNDKRDETITSNMMDGYSEVFNLNKDDREVITDLLS